MGIHLTLSRYFIKTATMLNMLLALSNLSVVVPQKVLQVQEQRRLKVGEPDGCGYIFSSGTNVTTNYTYIDITADGTNVSPISKDDDETGHIKIGFSFPFYDTFYTHFRISTNGVIFFGNSATFVHLENLCGLPRNFGNPNEPVSFLAVYYDDLVRQNNGGIYIKRYIDSCPIPESSTDGAPEFKREMFISSQRHLPPKPVPKAFATASLAAQRPP